MAAGTGTSDSSSSPLERERERCGLAQEQLARRIGANKTTVSRWESGQVLSCSLQVEVGQGLCLDHAVRYGTVEIWPCWNGRNQRWFAEPDGARFALRSLQAPGNCISAAQPGQQLELGPCAGPAAWWTETRDRDGSYLLRSAAQPGMCLTDSGGGTDLRTPVVLARCADRPEQRWIGVAAPPPSVQPSGAGGM